MHHPRAGSTLIEQILASHSQVEGTMELPDIPQIARQVVGNQQGDYAAGFLQSLAALPHDELRAYGERYLDQTRILRKSGTPFFIDKMPNNCLYVGLIHLILPNARIIDARRHPVGCCFSCFKQHFARGQNFTYSLDDIGRYYARAWRFGVEVDGDGGEAKRARDRAGDRGQEVVELVLGSDQARDLEEPSQA